MTYSDLITKVKEYMYLEDTGAIKIALASIIATRMKLGEPIWLIIIGASSGGKSQILRPLSLTDAKFLHRVDDLTENTFLSGMKVGKGKAEPSLLHRIGNFGMIVISDLTVIFSKNKEARSAILSQFRMIYDGEMTKFAGTSGEPLHWGPGSLGVLAGSTPTIYGHFEEVSDMGERFIYYRMKHYDEEKATRLAMNRKIYGKDLDKVLGGFYEEYIKTTIKGWEGDVVLPEDIRERIIKIAMFAERARTAISMDFQKKNVTRIPVSAFAMRVALQLEAVAKGLYIISGGKLEAEDYHILDWCAYSLTNEEKRGVLHILGSVGYGIGVPTSKVADLLGLSTEVTRNILQNLAAVKIIKRGGTGDGLYWQIDRREHWELIRSIEGLVEEVEHENREVSSEEKDEADEMADHVLDNWNKK
jgi:hypothetical protein